MNAAQRPPLIRSCRTADLPIVLNLLDQLGEAAHAEIDLRLEDLQQKLREMEAQPESYLNLVGEVEGDLAGFLSMVFYKSFFHQTGSALISELVVDRRHRGQGLGQALVARAIQEARARGMDEIEVSTEKSNLPAQHFYTKAGFQDNALLFEIEFE